MHFVAVPLPPHPSAPLLHALTDREKRYLIPFLTTKMLLQLRDADGAAKSLAAKGIIFQDSWPGAVLVGLTYNLQPWARRYLAQHPECLQASAQADTQSPS
jgi:hypothetical protein